MMEASQRQQIQDATDRLWERSQEKIARQLAAIDVAAMGLLEGAIDETTRSTAQREAHKIAGSAGMFGFHRASAVARELELLFAELPGVRAPATKAAALVEELHEALEDRGADRARDLPVPGEAQHPGQDVGLPTVLVAGFPESFRAALSTALRPHGLLSRIADHDGTGGVDPELPVASLAAAVVLVASGDATAACDLVRSLDRQSVPVIAVLPERADTATRLAAVRAGAGLLLEASQSANGVAQVTDAVATTLQSRSSSVPRILAVDDDETVAMAVREHLTMSLSAEVTTLTEPESFWPELTRVQPDLLLIDVDMPGASGLELCRLVRSDPVWRQLPVVFLSGRGDPATVQEVYAAGADDFVSKPVLGPELHARIANRLERTRLHRLLAETDPLTGLANRRRLETDLVRLQHLADRYATALSLAVLDVDRFKRVNDHYGHAAGDEVLRRLAAHLQDAFRGEDVVARLGGEEFVVAMLGMRRRDAVERLSSVLAAFADTVMDVEGQQLRVGASAGVAQEGPDGTGFEELYRAADAALRVAKASGRGRVLPAGTHGLREIEAVDVAIVEDDEILAELMRHTLTTQGYSCMVLSDGVEAVDRLVDGNRRVRASVVLLDIDLPGRNGFDVLQALRRAEVTSRSAVLVVSARLSEDDVVRALRLGARDHVPKPFSVPLLVQKLQSLVSGSR